MKINICDLDSLLYYSTWTKKDEQKTLEDCKQHLDKYITDTFNYTDSTHYVMYITVGKDSFRYKVDPEYKANRKDKIKPEHLDRLKDYVVQKYKAQFSFNYEADDLCLITKKFYQIKYPEAEVFLSSPDKDLLKLKGTHWNYQKNLWVDTTKEEASLAKWYSMVTGDSSDGIKAVPKAGIRAAERLLKDIKIVDYPSTIFNFYINSFNTEEIAIKEFYKTYQLLLIKDTFDNQEDYKKIIEPILIIK